VVGNNVGLCPSLIVGYAPIIYKNTGKSDWLYPGTNMGLEKCQFSDWLRVLIGKGVVAAQLV